MSETDQGPAPDGIHIVFGRRRGGTNGKQRQRTRMGCHAGTPPQGDGDQGRPLDIYTGA